MLSLPGSPPWGRSIGETLFSPQKTGAIKEETQQKIQIWYRMHFTGSYKKGCWGYLGMLTNLKIALLSTLKKPKAVIIFKRKKKILPDCLWFNSQIVMWWKLTNLWGCTQNKAKAKFLFNSYLPIPISSFKIQHTHAHTFAHTHTWYSIRIDLAKPQEQWILKPTPISHAQDNPTPMAMLSNYLNTQEVSAELSCIRTAWSVNLA